MKFIYSCFSDLKRLYNLSADGFHISAYFGLNMAASIADYRQQVNDNQISFSEALLELTDKEIAYQQQKSLKRRIKRARFGRL